MPELDYYQTTRNKKEKFEDMLDFEAIGDGLGLGKDEPAMGPGSKSNGTGAVVAKSDRNHIAFNFPKDRQNFRDRLKQKTAAEPAFAIAVGPMTADRAMHLQRSRLDEIREPMLKVAQANRRIQNFQTSPAPVVVEKAGQVDTMANAKSSVGPSHMMKPQVVTSASKPVGLINRMTAMSIDIVVVVALSGGLFWSALLLNGFTPNIYTFFNAGFAVPAGLFFAVMFFGYFLISEGIWRQSIGKRLLGMRIENGGIFSLLIRTLGFAFSVLPAGLGLIWCLLDERNRAWHDMVSGTELKRLG